MTGMQQLEQPVDSREYIPRHAWVEPADTPAVQAQPAPSAAGTNADPARGLQPYQLVETSSDYVTIVPERKKLWRGRKTA